MNLLCVLGLLIPIQQKRYWSDGALLLDLARKRNNTLDGLVYFLQSCLLDSIRPRDWNAAYVEAMLEARTGTRDDFAANVLGFYHAMDTGEIELAGELINLAVKQQESYPVASQSGILQEAAYFEARFRHNSVAALELLQRAPQTDIEPQMRPRAEAAILWAEGRCAEAAAKAQEAIALLPRSTDPGGAIAEADWLKELLDNCQKEIAQTSKPENLAAP